MGTTLARAVYCLMMRIRALLAILAAIVLLAGALWLENRSDEGSLTTALEFGGGISHPKLPPPLTPAPPCDVTMPQRVVPPEEPAGVDGVTENGHFVALWPDGIVVFKPGAAGSLEADGALGMKFWWWRPVKGGKLEITGRRLDAAAPPMRADVPIGYDSQQFTPTGLIFPTQGCWEVTGRVEDASITFVTLVLVQP